MIKVIVCPKCKKEYNDDCLYCGYCGTSLLSAKFMFDGKKNKKYIMISNKLYHSIAFNSIYIVAFLGFFIIALSLFLFSLNSIIDKIPFLEYHINQLLIKYSYIKEGVSLSYIAEQLSFITNFMIFILLGIISLLDALVCLFHIFFGSYLLYHKNQIIKGKKNGKPIAITRLNSSIAKFAKLFNAGFVLLMLVLWILKLNWM